MSSRASIAQLHYDKNYLSNAYDMIKSGETMPYIPRSVAEVTEQRI